MEEWIVRMYQAMGLTVPDADLAAAGRSSFQRERKTASDRLWAVKKLRGADTDNDLKRIVVEIEDILKKADSELKAAADSAGVERARALLKGVEAKAKEAETSGKRVEAAFGKDLEAMPDYLAALEAARKNRDIIAGLPGAKTQLVAMEKLLAEGQAKVVKDVSLTRGHAAGLDILKGHGAILDQAKAASEAYLKTDIPREVMDVWHSAKAKLGAHSKMAPEFQTRLYEKQLAEALDSGRQDAARAVKEIRQIAAAVEKEVEEQAEFKDQAEADLKAVEVLFGELAAQDGSSLPEGTQAQLEQDKQRAIALMADDTREYRRAAETLADCKGMCDSMLKFQKSAQKKWAPQAKKLKEITDTAKDLKSWQPLMTRAQLLLDVVTALEAALAKSGDYEAAGVQLDGIETTYKTLEADAKGVPRGADLKDFLKDCQSAKNEVDKVRAEVLKVLAGLEEKMEGVENRKSTKDHTDFEQCYQDWIRLVGKPTPQTVKTLEKTKSSTINDMRAIKKRVEATLKKPADLEKIVTAAKVADQKKADAGRVQKIEGLFKECEKFKVDVGTRRTEFDAATNLGLEGAGSTLKQIEADLENKLAEARKAFAEKQKRAGETVKRINKALEVFESDNPGFKPYLAQLKAQADDLKGLVESGDPDLYSFATEVSDALVTRMDAINPAKRPKGAKTFDDVEKKWTELSNDLGKGDLIKNRLPNTYAALYGELQDVIVKARESDPDEGLKILEPLSKEIAEARKKAESEDVLYKAFKTEKKQLESKWSDVTKLTKTWITDRTEAYEARFTSLVADAAATAKEEGKIGEASAKLKAIADDLEKIASAPNAEQARQALQEEDVKAMRQQELVKDMANQFEAAVEAYEKTTLPELRKALRGVKGADLDQLDSLEKVAKQASQIVEPYLNIISQWPHKRYTANSAPVPDKAVSDFSQAQKMLADATRNAEHLAANPEGTNVKFTGDLSRVAAEWVKFSKAYGVGINSLSAAIKKEAESEDAEIKKTARKVAGELAKAADHFEALAFANQLKVLSSEKSTDKAKLAARELALRKIRHYKKDLLSDPLLVRINDPKNPFERLNMQTSMLRASLKKLELEVLGGV